MVHKTYSNAIENKQPYECIHRVVHKDGSIKIVLEKSKDTVDEYGKTIHSFGFTQDITEQKKAEQEREKLIRELREALEKVKTLSGLLPICASCKKIRDDKGYWNQIEAYIQDHSEAEFSHGICPECLDKLYDIQ